MCLDSRKAQVKEDLTMESIVIIGERQINVLGEVTGIIQEKTSQELRRV